MVSPLDKERNSVRSLRSFQFFHFFRGCKGGLVSGEKLPPRRVFHPNPFPPEKYNFFLTKHRQMSILTSVIIDKHLYCSGACPIHERTGNNSTL